MKSIFKSRQRYKKFIKHLLQINYFLPKSEYRFQFDAGHKKPEKSRPGYKAQNISEKLEKANEALNT